MFLSLEVPLWPAAASATASQVDLLYILWVAISVVMTVLIFAAVTLFAIKFRRRPGVEATQIHGSLKLEIGWSIAPFLVMLVFFVWGTKLYFDNYGPPTGDVMDVYVVGKQWMWKVQYPGGQREINELHVPVGKKVRLTLASEDVIHSFFIPAFRMKKDVVPGRYNQYWFEATKPGRYHIFCAEYCGTEHSGMIGWATVMDPADYENWLSGGAETTSMADQGEKLFGQLGCGNCHQPDQQARGPMLRGVFGSKVLLDDGKTVTADEGFIRESILHPNARVVSGFKRDVMPTFEGQVTEEQLLQLIVYIKSLSPQKPVAPTAAGAPAKVSAVAPGAAAAPNRPRATVQ
jgi:cytochrome c oxidase subunit 2